MSENVEIQEHTPAVVEGGYRIFVSDHQNSRVEEIEGLHTLPTLERLQTEIKQRFGDIPDATLFFIMNPMMFIKLTSDKSLLEMAKRNYFKDQTVIVSFIRGAVCTRPFSLLLEN